MTMASALLAVPAHAAAEISVVQTAAAGRSETEATVKKVLFIGDSMTGWLSERFNAYGAENGFEVATVVWDGSTIGQWGSSPRTAQIVKSQKPDALLVSLGMNELLERNPEKRLSEPLQKLLDSAGDVPVIWIGPPSWPGKPGGDALNDFLAEKLGDSYFRSSGLEIQRQGKNNPHPTRAGAVKWMDAVATWLQESGQLRFPGLSKPEGSAMSRGKIFIYKKMKETL